MSETHPQPCPSPLEGEGFSKGKIKKGALAAAATLAALAAGALLIAAVRIAVPVRLGDSPVAPMTALSKVPPAVRDQPGLQAYAFGGWLILKGVRPYIDSRAEVYGDAFRAQYQRLASGDAALFARELTERKIAWTLLEPSSPLVALLDRTPGWRRLYADRFAVAYVRADALTPAEPAPGPDRRPAAP
jgi:hypothetical protein